VTVSFTQPEGVTVGVGVILGVTEGVTDKVGCGVFDGV